VAVSHQNAPHRRLAETTGLGRGLTATLALAVLAAVGVGVLLARVFSSPAIEGAASARDRSETTDERWARIAGGPGSPVASPVPVPVGGLGAAKPLRQLPAFRRLPRRPPWPAASYPVPDDERERLAHQRREEEHDRRDLASDRREALRDAQDKLRSLDHRLAELRGRIIDPRTDDDERAKLKERLNDVLREVEKAEREVVRAEWALRAVS
jgi:hypothetical protein